MKIIPLDDLYKLTPWFKAQLVEGNHIPIYLQHATHLTMYGQRSYNNNKSSVAVARMMKDVRSTTEADVINRQSEDNIGVAT